jgi:hypothetical protein
MKKVFLLLVLFTCINANAQDIELTESGAYEKKVVVVVMTTTTTTL